jgi:hypothetical protein
MIVVVTCVFVAIGLTASIVLLATSNAILAALMFSATGFISVRLSILAILSYKEGRATFGRPNGSQSVTLDTSGSRQSIRDELALTKGRNQKGR